MEIPGDKNQHLRHILYFGYRRGQKASEVVRDICGVYGETAITVRTAQKWFFRFNSGNFDLNDTSRLGRPSNFDEDHLKDFLRENGRQTCRELADKMNCSQNTVYNHLKSLGFKQKLGCWVPHELSEKDRKNRLQIVSQHLARYHATYGHNDRFLYRIVTGDEKWCFYTNMIQRKEWVAPGEAPKTRVKQEPHLKKTMICVWWDWEGLIHWEMLESNKTIDKELYLDQLRRVNEAIQLKRPDRQGGVILLHDNASPHTAKSVKIALQELEWEVLRHPAYSPDLAPTDYHLFRSLSNQMRGITFENDGHLETWLSDFFGSRSRDFWRNGINKLVDRWKQVMVNDGKYIED